MNSSAVIKHSEMTEEMQVEVIDVARLAIDKCNQEKEIACFIKDEFVKKYLGTWHCVVGRFFGSFVSHEKQHYIYFYIGQLAILLFKSG